MHRLLSILTVAALIALAAPTAVLAADEEKSPTPEPAVAPVAPSTAPAAPGWGSRGGGQCPWAAIGLGRGAAWGGPGWANGRGGQGFGRAGGYRGGRGWGARQGGGLGLGPYFVDQDGDGICDHRQTFPAGAP